MAEADNQEPRSGKRKYRKDKPWDHDGIDHWKIEAYTEEEGQKNPLIDESSFSTLFPRYREQYLRQWWPEVTRVLKSHHIDCELNLIEGSMTVKTTRKTWDPYAIINARDLIKLLARSVPFQQAEKIMQDDVNCDVIKIGNIVSNKERFVKRRQRLLGPNGATLKAIELLTDCYILVQGSTVCAMGSYKGLKQARRVVLDCMNNVHPVYNIKAMMIKRELAANDELKEESWDRFLPKFKKKNVKKKKKPIEKKEYTPFPPAQQQSKVDLQIESGEFFLRPNEKKRLEEEKRKAESAVKSAEKQAKRQDSFVPPKEKGDRKKRHKADNQGSAAHADVDVQAVKKKLKKRKRASEGTGSASDYLLS
eukprot:m.259625 g.259625  ORF g.259625 m.259625 type:complete len:364 (-) comp19205_c1_seq2:2094-3185(-)